MSQNEYVVDGSRAIQEEEKYFCEKKQCMLGIASVAIGIGGFVLASLL